jgi:hypothetical protein
MQPSKTALQVDSVLALLKLQGHASLRSVLPARQHVKCAVVLGRRDFINDRMKIGGGALLRHETFHRSKSTGNTAWVHAFRVRISGEP